MANAQAILDTHGLDIAKLRQDFPILTRTIHGKPLVYLDNAASSHMPTPVIDRWVRYQSEEHSNVHRGVHTLSQTATEAYEGARRKLQAFINAKEEREVIFVRGATDGINLVAHGYRPFLAEGDEILISALEHHSNIVPWQMLCEEKGCTLKVIPIDERGDLRMDEARRLITERTKLVAISHVSNALGTINPVAEIIRLAHAQSARVLVDGCQAAPHLPIDVQALDADWYVFSGHKMYGPTGIGVLYGKAALLQAMRPYQGGGDMIASVSFEKTTYNVIPYKFEAGTPPIAAAVALGAAVDYLSGLGLERLAAYEHELLTYATEQLEAIGGVKILGTALEKGPVISFAVAGVHPHDVGTILDGEGIAIRTGHHCAQPLMKILGVPATARASFAFYNTREEVDALVAGIRTVQKVFG